MRVAHRRMGRRVASMRRCWPCRTPPHHGIPTPPPKTMKLAAGIRRAGYEVAIDRAILRDLLSIESDSAHNIPDRRRGKNSPSLGGSPSADAANRLRCHRRIPVTHGTLRPARPERQSDRAQNLTATRSTASVRTRTPGSSRTLLETAGTERRTSPRSMWSSPAPSGRLACWPSSSASARLATYTRPMSSPAPAPIAVPHRRSSPVLGSSPSTSA